MSKMSQEQIMDYQSLYTVAHVLVPMLEEKQRVAYLRLIGDFRNTKSANLALVAECNAYTSLIDEVTNKLKAYERLSKEN